jgi:PIN domain nuclease of toxin-antitoxin system
MKLLVDTHVFIWWFNEPEKLSPKASALLADDGNALLLSAASIWEMQIKIQLGKLKFTVSLRELVESQEKTNGVQVLPVGLEHVLSLDALPAHHKDPFDRLLVAQANVEGAFLVSADPVFSSYPVKLLW